MGMAIIEETGFFDPVLYGLQVGTLLQVIAVGGGGGGGATVTLQSNVVSFKSPGGDAGETAYVSDAKNRVYKYSGGGGRRLRRRRRRWWSE